MLPGFDARPLQKSLNRLTGTQQNVAFLSRITPNFVNSGAMVAQRTTAGTLSTTRVIGQCDNVGVWASGGAVSAGTITQITSAVSGATGYACRAAGTTLTGSGQISHSIRMEARDALKYKNKTVSFSVVVDHDVGAPINYTLVAKKPTVADNFASTTTIATSGATSVLTAAGTKLTFNNVAIGDVSNGLELEVQAACGAVAAKNFNVTEFYIGIEALAGTYDAPDYDDELRRCKRYLISMLLEPLGIAKTVGLLYSGTFSYGTVMRAIPTLLPGAAFTTNAGSAGTVTAAYITTQSLLFTNPAANWTIDAFLNITGFLSAEL